MSENVAAFLLSKELPARGLITFAGVVAVVRCDSLIKQNIKLIVGKHITVFAIPFPRRHL